MSEKLQHDVVELQTLVAFQEQSLNELNQALTGQQGQIDKLQLELKLLRERLEAMEAVGQTDPMANEKPPHY